MVVEAEIQRQAELSAAHTELTKKAKWNLCGECGGPLVVAWLESQYQLKCGQNKAHIGTKSWRESPREKERGARQMAVDKGGTTIMAQYSGATQLTQTEARSILETLWPEAPASEVLKAAIICRQYGLNPLMRQIYLVGYMDHKTGGKEWSILIGIGATRMIARRSGPYSYEDNTPRLMTEGEQESILGEVDKLRYWAITKLQDREGMKAQGYGNWVKTDAVKGANKGNTPQNQAFIRSERAALDKLFPEKLPVGEVMAGEYMPEPETMSQAKSLSALIGDDTNQVKNPEPVKVPVARLAKPENKQELPGSDAATDTQYQELIRIGKALKYRDEAQIIGVALNRLLKTSWAECNKTEVALVINDWRNAEAQRGKIASKLKPQEEFESL